MDGKCSTCDKWEKLISTEKDQQEQMTRHVQHRCNTDSKLTHPITQKKYNFYNLRSAQDTENYKWKYKSSNSPSISLYVVWDWMSFVNFFFPQLYTSITIWTDNKKQEEFL